MIYNKYLKILFACVFVVSTMSCEDDDLGPFNSLVTDDTEEVQVTVTTLQDISAEGASFPVSVSLSRTFNVAATVTVQVETQDLRTAINTVTIPAGETTGMGLALVPGDQDEEFADLSETAIVSAIAVGADDGNGIVYLATSNEASVRLINDFPGSIAAGGITMTFAWDTAFTDDYDFFYAGAAGATGNPIENISIPNTAFGDGPIDVTYDPFAVAGLEDVPYILVIRVNNPDGSSELIFHEGALDAANSTAGTQFPLARITRTTTVDMSNPDNPTDVFTFEVEQLED